MRDRLIYDQRTRNGRPHPALVCRVCGTVYWLIQDKPEYRAEARASINATHKCPRSHK